MTLKKYEHTQDLTEQDRLDIKISWKNNHLTQFSLNYRAWINEKWYEVYRVDNYHGFLHKNCYWKTSEQIRIKDKDQWTLKMIFDHYVDEIVENFTKYRSYFEQSLK